MEEDNEQWKKSGMSDRGLRGVREVNDEWKGLEKTGGGHERVTDCGKE